MKSVEELQAELYRLAEKINAPKDYLKIGGQLSDVVINVEIHGAEYHYVVIERGREQKRIATKSVFDIEYFFIEAATFSLASKYELGHRIPGQDSRRLLFQHQLELMKMLGLEWYEKLKFEISEILKKAPYDDSI
jgi:hypothetical protein